MNASTSIEDCTTTPRYMKRHRQLPFNVYWERKLYLVLDLSAPTYSEITLPKPQGSMEGSHNRDTSCADLSITSQSIASRTGRTSSAKLIASLPPESQCRMWGCTEEQDWPNNNWSMSDNQARGDDISEMSRKQGLPGIHVVESVEALTSGAWTNEIGEEGT